MYILHRHECDSESWKIPNKTWRLYTCGRLERERERERERHTQDCYPRIRMFGFAVATSEGHINSDAY